MIIKIDTDELYPVYQIYESFGREVWVSMEFYEEYKNVMNAFWVMQSKLESMYDDAPKEESPCGCFSNLPSFNLGEESQTLTFKTKERYKLTESDNE